MDTSSFLLMNAFILKIISILLIASPAVIDILILLHRANGPSLQSPSARVAVVSKEISAMMPLVMLKHVAYFVGMLMLLRMRQLKGMRSPLVRIFVCVASLPLFLSFPLGVVMGCAGIVVAIRLPRFHQTLKVMLALVALLLLATKSARAFYDPGTQRWLNRDLIQEDTC